MGAGWGVSMCEAGFEACGFQKDGAIRASQLESLREWREGFGVVGRALEGWRRWVFTGRVKRLDSGAMIPSQLEVSARDCPSFF